MVGLRVVKVLEDFDMRAWRTTLETTRGLSSMKVGEAVVAFNRKRTIWRWITPTGDEDFPYVIEYSRSHTGKKCDMEKFKAIVQSGLLIDLTVSEKAWKKRKRRAPSVRRAA